jgi:hypothetical protein
MKVSLWIGDKKFSEFDVPDDAQRSDHLAMTIIDGDIGQVLFTEFDLAKKTDTEEIFKLTAAFNVKPEHISALENLRKESE